MRWTRQILMGLGLLAPSIVTAHPHVFVQAQITLIYDGTTPTAVQMDWIYDDYFSLLLTADLGIDLDGDMRLTADEQVILNDAVTEWPAGFEGDLEVLQDGKAVQLGPKIGHVMSFENGIITETHVRPLAAIGTADLVIRPFDPFYFVAYDVIDPIRFVGTDACRGDVTRADMVAARAMFAELTGGMRPEDVGAEEDFPEVGRSFSDTVTISCGF